MMRRQILWWLMILVLLASAVGMMFVSPEPSSSYAHGLPAITPTMIVSDNSFLPNILGLLRGPTATATVPPPTMTPSRTPDVTLTPMPTAEPDNHGPLTFNAPTAAQIAPGSSDRWQINLASAETLTLYAVPVQPAVLTLTLTQPDGTQQIFASADLTHLENVRLPAGTTTVDIKIESAATESADSLDSIAYIDYILLLNNDPTIAIGGILPSATTQSGSLPGNTSDLWLFNGREGQQISLSVAGSPNSDPHLELFDPAGNRLMIIDEGGPDEAETISNFTLPGNGLYTLIISERDIEPMVYTITAGQ